MELVCRGKFWGLSIKHTIYWMFSIYNKYYENTFKIRFLFTKMVIVTLVKHFNRKSSLSS